jgi:hypothetical protein
MTNHTGPGKRLALSPLSQYHLYLSVLFRFLPTFFPHSPATLPTVHTYCARTFHLKGCNDVSLRRRPPPYQKGTDRMTLVRRFWLALAILALLSLALIFWLTLTPRQPAPSIAYPTSPASSPTITPTPTLSPTLTRPSTSTLPEPTLQAYPHDSEPQPAPRF